MLILQRIREGESRLFVPIARIPEEGEVFYNPAQALSRDFSILVYSAHNVEVLDAMSGTGARAVRLVRNGVKAVANDHSKKAVKVIKINRWANDLEFEVLNERAEVLFHTRKFEAIDLDPFGTPAPFIHCALRSAKKVLGVTATDTAALVGTYPRVALRRYGIKMQKLPNYPEIGTRALIGFVVREAAKLEIAAIPVFAHAFRHYFRAYFRIKRGAGRADKLLKNLQFYKGLGPIWMGDLWEKELLKEMERISKKVEFGSKFTEKHLKIIKKEAELGEKPYIELHWLCKQLKITPPPMKKVLEATNGTRTHFSPTGFRTEMSEEEVKEVLKRFIISK